MYICKILFYDIKISVSIAFFTVNNNIVKMIKSTTAGIFSLFYFQSWIQTDITDYTSYLKIVDYWLDAQKDFDRLPGQSVAKVQDQNKRQY